MKVAIVVESFPKLSETFVLNHIKGLIDAGVEVNIFSFYDLKESKVHSAVQSYQLNNLIQYKPTMPAGRLSRLFKGFFLFSKHVLRYPKPILQSVNFFQYGVRVIKLHYLFEVCTFLSPDKFDIIHCHFGTTAEKLALYMKWGVLNGPLVISFHGYDVDSKFITKGKYYKLLQDAGSLFIANSLYTKKKLQALGFADEKINILPVCPDISIFIRKNYPMREGFKLLTVARLIEVKGVEYGIKAVAKIKHEIKAPIQYVIAGTGPLQKHLEQLVIELDLSDTVRMVGNKTQSEIVALMREADVFLLTGITDSEGREESQGLVIQEAQAAGLPVIVSNVGGIAEGVLNEQTGFLIRQKNTEDIAEKILYLYEHPEDREKMGKAGRKFVEEKYSISRSTVQLIDFYNKLISK